MKNIEQHEEDLEKLNRLEYWSVKLFPFLISFTLIYWLVKTVC